MKDFLRMLYIIIMGVAVAVFIYPFFHELGHVIISYLVGAEIKDFTLFPLPSVLCNVGGISNFDKILIGIGGMLLPFAAALCFPRKWMLTGYIRLLLKGIVLLSFLISFISVVANCNAQDDIVQTMSFWKSGRQGIVFFVLLSASYILVSIIKDRPIEAVKRYFEI